MSHIILLPCGKAIWLISPSSYLGNKSNQEIYIIIYVIGTYKMQYMNE